MTTTETTTKKELTSSDTAEVKRPARGGRRNDGKDNRRQPRRERPASEFEQKMLNIRRVTRVVAGGRRFAFSVALVIGDKNGSVGFGLGKAGDTSLAIQKAFNQARKSMITLNLNDQRSLAHEVSAKFNSATVRITPNGGRGLVAGSAIRSVLELAGVRDVTSKVMSKTKNPINIARATMKALTMFGRPYQKKSQEAVVLESFSVAENNE